MSQQRSIYHVAIELVSCPCCGSAVGDLCHRAIGNSLNCVDKIPVHMSRRAEALKINPAAVEQFEAEGAQKK